MVVLGVMRVWWWGIHVSIAPGDGDGGGISEWTSHVRRSYIKAMQLVDGVFGPLVSEFHLFL